MDGKRIMFTVHSGYLAPRLERRVKYLPIELILYLPPADRRLNPELNRPSITIGSRIRYHRLQKGFTQAELAEKTGVARSTLERLESDSVSALNPLLIQKAVKPLGIDPASLFSSIKGPVQSRHFVDHIIPQDSLGSIIKNLRLKRGLQQRHLAKKIGVSRACVCRYEKNITTPNGKILVKIARILKIGISQH